MFALFMLPGLLAVGPGQLLARRRDALVTSYACWGVLIFADAFHLDWRLAATLAVALGVAVGRLWKSEARGVHLSAPAWLAILGVVLAVFSVQVAITYPDFVPRGSTTWYYAGLAEQVRASGGYPQWSPEWGISVPFLADYPYFVSLGGASARFLEGFLSLAHRVEAFRLFVVIVTAWTAAEAFYALGRGWVAVLMAGFMLICGHFTWKIGGYRPEGFAYGALFLTIWVCLESVFCVDESPDRHQGALPAQLSVAVALLVCLLSHGAVAAGAVAALAAMPAVSALKYRRWRQTGGRLLSILAIALAAYVAVDLLAAGEITQLENALAPVNTVEESKDLTLEFFRLHRRSGKADAEADIRLRMTAGLLNRFRLSWVPPHVVLLFGALALAFALVRRRTRHRALWVLLWAIAIGGGGSVFLVLWDTYVPQRIGPERIWPLLVIPTFMAAALGMSELLGTGRWGKILQRKRLIPVSVFCFGFGLFFYVAGASYAHQKDKGMIASDYEFLAAQGFSHSDTVLTNGFSEGGIGTITGGNCYIGGVAPYNKDRRLLSLSVEHMQDARAFFRRPRKAKACSMGIDYIVEGRARWSIGMARFYRTNSRRLARIFQEHAHHPQDRIRVYRVVCDDEADR